MNSIGRFLFPQRRVTLQRLKTVQNMSYFLAFQVLILNLTQRLALNWAGLIQILRLLLWTHGYIPWSLNLCLKLDFFLRWCMLHITHLSNLIWICNSFSFQVCELGMRGGFIRIFRPFGLWRTRFLDARLLLILELRDLRTTLSFLRVICHRFILHWAWTLGCWRVSLLFVGLRLSKIRDRAKLFWVLLRFCLFLSLHLTF